jgi:hypothetical protein
VTEGVGVIDGVEDDEAPSAGGAKDEGGGNLEGGPPRIACICACVSEMSVLGREGDDEREASCAPGIGTSRVFEGGKEGVNADWV